MSGRWLAAHGFKIGEPVYVTVEQGGVILTNTPAPAEASGADLVIRRDRPSLSYLCGVGYARTSFLFRVIRCEEHGFPLQHFG